MAKRVAKKSQATQSQGRKFNATWVIVGVVVVGVMLLGALLILNQRPEPEITEIQRFAGLSRDHDPSLEYAFEELPPAGGAHNPTWQNCGIYAEPIRPENAVHSLEHGAVWVTYQEDLPEADVATLQDAVRGKSFVILSPYPNQRSPIVLTAWGLQLEVDSADDARITQFVDKYRVGPQTPERGAACTGGIGEPIS